MGEERRVGDRVKVNSGKNRGRMVVERLRERLIRELREGGSQERKKAEKERKKQANIVKKSKSSEPKTRLQHHFLLSELHTS